MPAVVNQDEVDERIVHEGDIAFRRRRLGAAAGTRRLGLSHYVVAPRGRGMPVHVHGEEEEIFFVVSGRGIGYELGADAYPLAAGDVIVHRPGRRPHTRLADEDAELELLAFSSGSETPTSYLPRAQVMWCGAHWVPVDAPHPFRAEGLAGPLERPRELAAPPAHVVALAAVDEQDVGGAAVRRVGAAGGAARAGLNHVTLAPGTRGTPPHCHSLEEELFVVLAGSGTLTLGAAEHPVRAGDVVARPAGTGVSHHLSAGADGLVYLAYGTREPGDAVRYPEAGTVALRGLGITLSLDR